MEVKKAKNEKWWQEGIQFQCQGSGRCCVSRGEYGYVYLTLEDRKRFAKYFGLTTTEFSRKYCKKAEGYWTLRDFSNSCVFLENQNCSVYEARPTQCRTWPFWPENMSAKGWKKEVTSYCPGVGKGKLWKPEEIEGVLKIQVASERNL